jgi:hypothetical protein
MLAVRIIMRSALMDWSPPFTGDGAGASAGAGIVITFPSSSPLTPGGSGGISMTGAGAGRGAGIDEGAGAGAAQAINATASIIKVETTNNLFIKTPWLLYSEYKTKSRAKGYHLWKASQLTAA